MNLRLIACIFLSIFCSGDIIADPDEIDKRTRDFATFIELIGVDPDLAPRGYASFRSNLSSLYPKGTPKDEIVKRLLEIVTKNPGPFIFSWDDSQRVLTFGASVKYENGDSELWINNYLASFYFDEKNTLTRMHPSVVGKKDLPFRNQVIQTIERGQ